MKDKRQSTPARSGHPRQRGTAVTADSSGEAIKIYINGVLHVSAPLEGLAVHSWIKKEGHWYCIEYYTKTGIVLTEYNEFWKWEAVLRLLESAL